MSRQYTTIEAVSELMNDNTIQFIRVGDPDYILFADSKDIKFKVHTYEGNFNLILYKFELWERIN